MDQELFASDEVSFADIGLSEALQRAVAALNYTRPTQVQHQLIPLVLAGRDVLGQSRTGTGKTAAFGLPILQMLNSQTDLQALVLVPTRELAIQVSLELRELARFLKAGIVAVYGGQRIRIQADRLRKKPEILVGTPGRVMDLHGRGLLA